MLVTKVSNRLHKYKHIFKQRLNLYRLSRTDSQIARSLEDALKATLASQTSVVEKEWINQIENLRNELSSSTTEIVKTDFGVREEASELTRNESQKGVEVIETIGHICRTTSKPPFWSLLLFRLVREIKPVTSIEMGTSVGISGAYQAAALKLNGRGRMVTLEGAAAAANVAENNFHKLGFDNIEIIVGKFQDTLPDVLHKYQPIDYIFVDGHHDEQATIAYFKQICPFLSPKAIVVFDDISWTEGMKRAWATIATDERVNISVDLSSMGICLFDNAQKRKQNFWVGMP